MPAIFQNAAPTMTQLAYSADQGDFAWIEEVRDPESPDGARHRPVFSRVDAPIVERMGEREAHALLRAHGPADAQHLRIRAADLFDSYACDEPGLFAFDAAINAGQLRILSLSLSADGAARLQGTDLDLCTGTMRTDRLLGRSVTTIEDFGQLACSCRDMADLLLDLGPGGVRTYRLDQGLAPDCRADLAARLGF